MGLLHPSEAKVFAKQLENHNSSRALDSERRPANSSWNPRHWRGASKPSGETQGHSVPPPRHSRMGELRSAPCLSHSHGRRGDSHGIEQDCPACERYRIRARTNACPEKMASQWNSFHADRHGIDVPNDALRSNRPPVARETGGVLIRGDPKHTSKLPIDVSGVERCRLDWNLTSSDLLWSSAYR